jgi:hypothetical protein
MMNCSKCGKEYKSDNRWYKNHIAKCNGPKKSKGVRKNADYQYTELLLALLYLGLKSIIPDEIRKFIRSMYDTGKLKTNKGEYPKKFIEDMESDIKGNKFDKMFIVNFKSNVEINNIECVYLTGKSFSDFPELVELNKDSKDEKPNSDIFIKEKSGKFHGCSCKKNSKCPLTNKIVEEYGTIEELKTLFELREKVLNEKGITKDNYRDKRGKNGEISMVFRNPTNKYWVALRNHILKYSSNFIKGVLYSIAQGQYLNYPVYEYDGKELIDTKDRFIKEENCFIRPSEIFRYGKTGPRKAAKIWFDFVEKTGDTEKILYNLEVRFKGIYFNDGGKPQLFIYKTSGEEIDCYKKAKEKHEQSLINNISNSE